jgi:hypothetical protein
MNKEQNAALEAERVAFEAWQIGVLIQEGYDSNSVHCVMERGSNGGYSSIRVQGAWVGWKACRAQLAAPAGVSARTADALKSADWSGVSIGNKALISKAIELLAAPSSAPAGVSDGWRLVPVEPTPEMIQAALDKPCFDPLGDLLPWSQITRTSYAAMLAAAPPPEPASDVVQVPREWVAVQDGLPSVGDKCLIKIPVSKRFEVEGAEYKGDGDWLGAWCSRKGRDQTYKVSHWMLAGDLLNGGRV